MSELTDAQKEWLGANPYYCLCGKPRAGITFHECGTLYADGRFDKMAPMKSVKLEPGCVLIGVPSDLTGSSPVQKVDDDDKFHEWIRALEEDVIQEGFGYEPGEFTVYPSLWRPLYDEGLTPLQAWTRALDAFGEERRLREAEQIANYERIVASEQQ